MEITNSVLQAIYIRKERKYNGNTYIRINRRNVPIYNTR